MIRINKKALLLRVEKNEKQTLGRFYIFNERGKLVFHCFTLELPDLKNAKNVSRIPAGDYEVIPRHTPKRGAHFHITNVPGRTWILIHSGNYYRDIQGCILPGSQWVDIDGDGYKDVINSRDTLMQMVEFAPEGFDLTIMDE